MFHQTNYHLFINLRHSTSENGPDAFLKIEDFVGSFVCFDLFWGPLRKNWSFHIFVKASEGNNSEDKILMFTITDNKVNAEVTILMETIKNAHTHKPLIGKD